VRLECGWRGNRIRVAERALTPAVKSTLDVILGLGPRTHQAKYSGDNFSARSTPRAQICFTATSGKKGPWAKPEDDTCGCGESGGITKNCRLVSSDARVARAARDPTFSNMPHRDVLGRAALDPTYRAERALKHRRQIHPGCHPLAWPEDPSIKAFWR
jgi:hypothetical protein